MDAKKKQISCLKFDFLHVYRIISFFESAHVYPIGLFWI